MSDPREPKKEEEEEFDDDLPDPGDLDIEEDEEY
jgi:hypothetical protein